jgi:hypothetical protein
MDEGKFVNSLVDNELFGKLITMCEADMRDRSSFIRWLIAQEWARRHEPKTYTIYTIGDCSDPEVEHV